MRAAADAGVTTDELTQISLALAGLTAVPLDSGIHVPGRGIRRVLFALDVNVGLLVLDKQLGYDAVVGHHPLRHAAAPGRGLPRALPANHAVRPVRGRRPRRVRGQPGAHRAPAAHPPEGYLILTGLTGHDAGDSYGFTPYVRALRQRGLEVACVGGAIDAAQFPAELAPSEP